MATTNTMLTFDGEQTLGTMLGGKVGLRVPPSQRSYRWKKEHIEALLNDIRENLDEDEYYVGSVIVVTSTKDKTFVFDGQQRLATTSILIAAIRDKFLELGEEKDARDTEEEFLFSEKRRTTDPVPHFILNTEDQTFFFDRAISRPTATDRRGARNRANTPANEKSTLPQSNKRIDQAAKIAADYVKKYVVAELPHDEAVDRLHKWLDFLRDSLRIILVKAGDDRTAFTMFETMNDRGLRLSAADLLKNRLYADAGNRQEEVIQKWTSMSAILESADSSEEVVMEYLRCYWIANNGHTRSKDLYDKIKAKVKTPSQAVNLAAKLEQSARDYAAIITSSHEKWSSRGATLRTKIETLRLLGITQLRPVLLAAINNFNNKEFDALVEACVSWSVRSLLGGVSSGNIEADYSRTALKITNREITKASQAKSEMSKVIPNDSTFISAMLGVRVPQQKLARYYLNSMQRQKDGIQQPQYVPNLGDEITLEHILPENPTGDAWKHFTVEERQQYTNRLGNLALLTATANSSIGNVGYNKKEATLKSSDFSLTSMAAGQGKWTTTQIENRQAELSQLAAKTWPL